VERVERELRKLRRDFDDYKWAREAADSRAEFRAQNRTFLLSAGGFMVLAWVVILFIILGTG
jgi:hypothetical protein